MGSNNDFTIQTVGNVVIDTMIHVENFPNEGIACKVKNSFICGGASLNIARAYKYFTNKKITVSACYGKDFFKYIDSDSIDEICNINNTYTDVNATKAYVLCCVNNASRTGLVEWGACRATPKMIIDCDWTHFSYCDTLDDLSKEKIKNINGIKSADLTSFDYTEKKRERVKNCLKSMNYIICSPEEASALLEVEDLNSLALQLGTMCKNFVIMHTPEGSYVSDGSTVDFISASHPVNKKFDVVGAGDTFAAAFIKNVLNNTKNREIYDVVVSTHLDVYSYLSNRSGDIK